MQTIEVLFTPAEFAALAQRDLSRTTAVVFDVLRATSTMITALANGAAAIVPVANIAEALARKAAQPDVRLAGEREGLRIRAAQTGGVDFDLGNSPREFTRAAVAGRTIVMTTTNGTRALRACAGALDVFVASFLNLDATAARLRALRPEHLLIVCSGTGEDAALEDTLGAGGLVELVASGSHATVADSAIIAREVFRTHQEDLIGAMPHARNGRRLLALPELAEDVAFCLRCDALPITARLVGGVVRAESSAAAPG
ncbi:MAG: 2-phosphosulfolactate phosphatase [Verrucomicrobia bacterium]|nr:2-phosphosulfolactate phosphatase [Verrucomicrobiota bacterium]